MIRKFPIYLMIILCVSLANCKRGESESEFKDSDRDYAGTTFAQGRSTTHWTSRTEVEWGKPHFYYGNFNFQYQADRSLLFDELNLLLNGPDNVHPLGKVSRTNIAPIRITLHFETELEDPLAENNRYILHFKKTIPSSDDLDIPIGDTDMVIPLRVGRQQHSVRLRDGHSSRRIAELMRIKGPDTIPKSLRVPFKVIDTQKENCRARHMGRCYTLWWFTLKISKARIVVDFTPFPGIVNEVGKQALIAQRELLDKFEKYGDHIHRRKEAVCDLQFTVDQLRNMYGPTNLLTLVAPNFGGEPARELISNAARRAENIGGFYSGQTPLFEFYRLHESEVRNSFNCGGGMDFTVDDLFPNPALCNQNVHCESITDSFYEQSAAYQLRVLWLQSFLNFVNQYGGPAALTASIKDYLETARHGNIIRERI